jgi:hypothetical protein
VLLKRSQEKERGKEKGATFTTLANRGKLSPMQKKQQQSRVQDDGKRVGCFCENGAVEAEQLAQASSNPGKLLRVQEKQQ